MTLDLGTQTLLSVALLLALNNVLVRFHWARRLHLLFWAIQALNLTVAGWLMWRGLPGYDDLPVVAWLLGLLLVFHVVQNLRWRRAIRDDDAHDAQRVRRASALRAALDDPPTPSLPSSGGAVDVWLAALDTAPDIDALQAMLARDERVRVLDEPPRADRGAAAGRWSPPRWQPDLDMWAEVHLGDEAFVVRLGGSLGALQALEMYPSPPERSAPG